MNEESDSAMAVARDHQIAAEERFVIEVFARTSDRFSVLRPRSLPNATIVLSNDARTWQSPYPANATLLLPVVPEPGRYGQGCYP
jgi:hypothetical protein